ncbi:MAG: HipA domain-containing protein [Chitinophagaceae bacterium]|nr:HipA domain-containing protein [Chitinophagaceae bacterium]
MSNCLICYKDSGVKEFHEKCVKQFFGTETIPELELNKDLLKKLAEETINKRIAVTGVQPKLSLTLEKIGPKNTRLTIVGLWGEFILKPQHEKIPIMPETEDLTMHLASIFGIEVCDHTLLRAKDGSLVYLARRFDRKKGKKIHMEDFCQLSEFLTENKYKGSYEKVGKLIIKYCTNSGLDVLRYFELLLFSYLSGNNDMHLKNFSVLHIENEIVFSPAYDLINVNLINPKDKEDLALMLGGKKTNIRLMNFTALGKLLEIPEKVLQNCYKKYSSAEEDVHKQIMSSFLPKDYKEQYWKIWRKKQEIFLNK